MKRYITEIWADAMEMLTPRTVRPETPQTPTPAAEPNNVVPF
jgi:hypothetical protein